jgi:hypothetical protein
LERPWVQDEHREHRGTEGHRGKTFLGMEEERREKREKSQDNVVQLLLLSLLFPQQYTLSSVALCFLRVLSVPLFLRLFQQ